RERRGYLRPGATPGGVLAAVWRRHAGHARGGTLGTRRGTASRRTRHAHGRARTARGAAARGAHAARTRTHSSTGVARSTRHGCTLGTAYSAAVWWCGGDRGVTVVVVGLPE